MRRLIYILCLVMVIAVPAWADGIVREMTSLSVTLPNGGQAKLEAMVVRPDRPGRFPLVVMVHGTPRDAGKRPSMSPAAFIGPAEFFATRGYAVGAIMRRGFGHSDGPYAEAIAGPCSDRDYLPAAKTSAEDVLGAVAALRGQPWVDFDRIVLLGQSTGGLAVTAAAATDPPGVIGILDFAGGRGSDVPDHVCSGDRLVDDFGVLGQTVRIPALWLYSENDHFFSPDLGYRMFDAYRRGGAPAQLVILPPVGTDGHFALTMAPSDVIWPPVETFLASLRLP
jgi:dienelactone hydrolase